MDIYQYEDYKLLLRDLFEERKTTNPKYSYRKFAQAAGIANPGFLNDVIKGRRKLSQSAIEQVCQGFELNEKESDFFKLIVNYGQAKTTESKQEFFRQILYRRSRSNFARLNPTLHHYYTDYRYSLIRTALECNHFKGNWDSFSQYFSPNIPVNIIKKMLRELCEWNLVSQDEQGIYQANSEFVEPPETLNSQVRHLNHTWLHQAQEALFNIPPDERHISTMIVNINEESQNELKQMILDFRQKVFQLSKSCTSPDKTIQLSIAQFEHGSQQEKS